jgi:hypothetical protein
MVIKITKSAKAKAEMQAMIVKDQQAAALQDQSPLTTVADMKGFLKQHPTTKALLGQIFMVWRGSSSRRRNVRGCWAAYPYTWWAERTKLSVATLKRHLDLLEGYGLIERQRGHHQGKRVLAFVRPTVLALKLSDHRPSDWQHLGLGPNGSEPKPLAKPKPASSVIANPKPAPDADETPASLAEILAILNED